MGSYFSVPLAVSIAIPLIAGSIVSASTADNVLVWYKTLKKPSWNLPTPIFGPTWSFLYVFLGLASFVVWTQGGFAEQSGALILYAVNLVLNLSWMPLFFNKKDFVLAQIDNIATLGTAVVLAKQFYRVKPVAGYLLWPYVAFLAFANALNFYHTKNNQNRAIDEDLYHSEDKKNPGEPGYGAATDRSKGTKGLPSEGKQAPGYGSTTGRIFGETDGPSSGVNACLAAPCVGRGRSGRPVLVCAAAAPQMKMRAAAGKRVGTVRSTMSLHRAPTVARFA